MNTTNTPPNHEEVPDNLEAKQMGVAIQRKNAFKLPIVYGIFFSPHNEDDLTVILRTLGKACPELFSR